MERFTPCKVASVIFLVFVLVLGAATELRSQAETSLYAQTPGVQQRALSPQELFAKARGSIFIVVVRDQSGILVAQGSGVAISE